ncbi:RsmB/NOP family class I SAM-dependent RNA methyltransferase [Clostridium sp. AL.422]|uniref:RsmB/NOP family class I SAM-dependent RNA methyltransferase n=1 Tax=Clostridium TaxID=1485 RepID=UPI00293DDCE1|nr:MULTISPECIES: RsmB/NOP family class I SAM-dependent RNA methyltransferase [unclassified Clostridium]MDV4152426.1 RsmB/NOP family class I SAM-dependent RNA methyltransferase [Clostridium sp. AL.422]
MSIKEVKNYLPGELIEILEKIYSTGQLDTIYRSYYKGRNASFRINSLKGNLNEVMEELMNKKIKAVNHPLLKNAFIVKEKKESILRKLEVYKYGKIYLQNISSMLPPLFLDLSEDNVILDMCAAPGGKSLYMADLTNNKAIILANDVNEVRRERLKYNIEKQGASSIIAFGSDGCTIGKRLNEYFDRILLDAPCSGEGILKFNSSKSFKSWSKKKVELASKLQKKLFDSAYHALKPGGVMVYSTCTLNPFENEEVVNYALQKYKDLSLEKIDIKLPNIIRGLTSYDDNNYNDELKKTIRVIPNDYMEGFFIAKLIKAEE